MQPKPGWGEKHKPVQGEYPQHDLGLLGPGDTPCATKALPSARTDLTQAQLGLTCILCHMSASQRGENPAPAHQAAQIHQDSWLSAVAAHSQDAHSCPRHTNPVPPAPQHHSQAMTTANPVAGTYRPGWFPLRQIHPHPNPAHVLQEQHSVLKWDFFKAKLCFSARGWGKIPTLLCGCTKSQRGDDAHMPLKHIPAKGKGDTQQWGCSDTVGNANIWHFPEAPSHPGSGTLQNPVLEHHWHVDPSHVTRGMAEKPLGCSCNTEEMDPEGRKEPLYECRNVMDKHQSEFLLEKEKYWGRKSKYHTFLSILPVQGWDEKK